MSIGLADTMTTGYLNLVGASSTRAAQLQNIMLTGNDAAKAAAQLENSKLTTAINMMNTFIEFWNKIKGFLLKLIGAANELLPRGS